jgi:hypothetical protein
MKNTTKIVSQTILTIGCLGGAGWLITHGYKVETWGWFAFFGFLGICSLMDA